MRHKNLRVNFSHDPSPTFLLDAATHKFSILTWVYKYTHSIHFMLLFSSCSVQHITKLSADMSMISTCFTSSLFYMIFFLSKFFFSAIKTRIWESESKKKSLRHTSSLSIYIKHKKLLFLWTCHRIDKENEE